MAKLGVAWLSVAKHGIAKIMENYRTAYNTGRVRDRDSTVSHLTEHLDHPPYRFHNRDMSVLKLELKSILEEQSLPKKRLARHGKVKQSKVMFEIKKAIKHIVEFSEVMLSHPRCCEANLSKHFNK